MPETVNCGFTYKSRSVKSTAPEQVDCGFNPAKKALPEQPAGPAVEVEGPASLESDVDVDVKDDEDVLGEAEPVVEAAAPAEPAASPPKRKRKQKQ